METDELLSDLVSKAAFEQWLLCRYCGEGHAQVYISRWFDSSCTPPKPHL